MFLKLKIIGNSFIPIDPKETSRAGLHIISWEQLYACSRKAQLSFEMLFDQFKVCLLSEKIVSKIRKFIQLSVIFLCSPPGILEGMRRAAFQIRFGAQTLNEE